MSFSAFDDAKIRTFLSILYVLIRYDTLSFAGLDFFRKFASSNDEPRRRLAQAPFLATRESSPAVSLCQAHTLVHSGRSIADLR